MEDNKPKPIAKLGFVFHDLPKQQPFTGVCGLSDFQRTNQDTHFFDFSPAVPSRFKKNEQLQVNLNFRETNKPLQIENCRIPPLWKNGSQNESRKMGVNTRRYQINYHSLAFVEY